MLRSEENQLLTHVGPGTPGGEFLRRYWQPVGVSNQVTAGGKPTHVRILGEDLVLFRDDAGNPGLLGLHCSHRLTSLEYGRVEDGGIRCPFHGWLYDVAGRCLEQPAEPEDSTYRQRIRHTSYPCQELGGLIFAYLGATESMPLLPRYEVLVREDGTRKADYYPINSNYLQNLEGAVDTVHGAYLHTDHWSSMKHRLAGLPRPKVEIAETDYGIWQRCHKASPSPNGPVMNVMYAYFFMPAGFLRVQESSKESNAGDWKKFQSWYVPSDDTHTLRFQAAFAPFERHGDPYQWPAEADFLAPGPQNDYFRDYERYDTISGIPVNAPGTAIKGFLAQDSMVNESQGPIVDRSLEHLTGHDHVLTAMRKIMLQAIEDVQDGRDPKHVIRDPEFNDIVHIRGLDELERV
jgi:phenylpropionate dioxygenase-like ring-hydroxylating dioxygenase large terminal subunit